MELIIVIFFFSLTSAVCLQLFVKAHVVASNTKEMNTAVLWAESTGELFYEYAETFSPDIVLYKDYIPEGYDIVFDKYEDADFVYLDYTYISSSDNREIYSISFKKHIKEVKD